MTTISKNGKLTTGQTYDVDALRCTGWDGPGVYDDQGHRNPGMDGYDYLAYFDADGRYLGPDMHGVEPLFEIADEKAARN